MTNHTIINEAHEKADVLLRQARGISALLMHSAGAADGKAVSAAAEAVVKMLDEAHDLIGQGAVSRVERWRPKPRRSRPEQSGHRLGCDVCRTGASRGHEHGYAPGGHRDVSAACHAGTEPMPRHAGDAGGDQEPARGVR